MNCEYFGCGDACNYVIDISRKFPNRQEDYKHMRVCEVHLGSVVDMQCFEGAEFDAWWRANEGRVKAVCNGSPRDIAYMAWKEGKRCI